MNKVVVVGGGHAGCEAALASSNIGVETILITTKINKIAITPCNPAVGGPAKGIVVREIDALGGYMGINTDNSSIQIKKLNESKGEAVHALRAQVDKKLYPKNMQDKLLKQKNLQIIESTVQDLLIIDNKITGVKLSNGDIIKSNHVVLTTGTYMDSYIMHGTNKISMGPEGVDTTKELSKSLLHNGVELFRLKTGTPPRISKKSIDYTGLEEAGGSNLKLAFSHYHPKYNNYEDQIKCHLIYTNEDTHKIIEDNILKSSMYSGNVKGVGPRYCPSIEDKIVRFRDKKRHQLFLEPETRMGDSIYVQGLSTSLPHDIQLKILKTLPGLKNVDVINYGYAIEYDAIKSKQLKNTLELKNIKGLYSAGQINGTSGYEEAAGQGLIAGINAALSIKKKKPFILNRSNSYIGLMIDDLITKGTLEPYRLLTSRSEYRLLLRNDNADLRLSELGYKIGLLNEDDYFLFEKKKEKIIELKKKLNEIKITPSNFTPEMGQKNNTQNVTKPYSLREFLKRPNIKLKNLTEIYDFTNYSTEVLEHVEIETKYSGYIDKIYNQINRLKSMEKVILHKDINYNLINNLALEAREKLNEIKPETIGQASRISGVNPSDITALEIYIESRRRKNEAH